VRRARTSGSLGLLFASRPRSKDELSRVVDGLKALGRVGEIELVKEGKKATT